MKKYIIMMMATILIVASCKKWDDHIALNTPGLNETLFAQIKGNSDLSLFASYIEEANLDTLLNSSMNLTVFAPSNEALKQLPDSIGQNPASLRRFLLNLIAGKAYYTRDASSDLRIRMLSGKRIQFDQGKFQEANLTKSDMVAKNGVLHIIDQPVLPLPNIWEYLNATKGEYKQNAYIASLNYKGQDLSQAEIDSIDLTTGEPVYKTGTGIVEINTFKTKVYDVADEDSLYTYFVLTDAAFESQQASMKPYFKALSEDTSISNANWSVVKDLVVSGLHENLSATTQFVTKSNVHFSINPASIVATQKVSNGIVYVMSSLSMPIAEKIPVVYIQGENPIGFSSETESALEDIFYRKRFNPITRDTFTDIYVNRGSSGANFYADYATNNLYTATYKVYWVALNDYVSSGQGDDAYGTTGNLNQIVKVMANDSLSTVLFNETGVVEPNTYTETYIGEFTNDGYNWLLSYPRVMPDGSTYEVNPATKFIRLQAPSSNSSPYNLTLDYLKFVPVFN
jgi:uncharacterized surface protein with fasciclin (FAS1) repeats